MSRNVPECPLAGRENVPECPVAALQNVPERPQRSSNVPVCPRAGKMAKRSHRARHARSPVGMLTPREREILGEMAQGKNNAAIAHALVLSERAVEKHINSIFSKLGLSEERDTHRRVKAVLLYLADQQGDAG